MENQQFKNSLEEGKIPIFGAQHTELYKKAEANEVLKGREIFASGETGGMDLVNTQIYSPELMPDIWQMAKSEQEKKKWIRFFYNTDPYIYSITQLHTMYPLSDFDIVASDEKVSAYYKSCAFNRQFNMNDLMMDMSLGMQKFGESIMMGFAKQEQVGVVSIFKWQKFITMEPEVINIYKSALDDKENYTMLLTNEFKSDIRQMQEKGHPVHPLIEEAMQYNKSEIDLDQQYMSKVINKTDASAVRGTSPIQCLLRTLMYQDKVNLLKNTAIDRYRYPLEIWKIGDVTNGILPNPEMLKGFEGAIKAAKDNPPYALFVPSYVNYEVAGYSSQSAMFNYKDDYEWVRDSILVGLGVSKDIILGESKGWGQTKQMTLQKMMMIYQNLRQKFTSWMINEFFTPIAEKNGFITDKGVLNIPQIVWKKDLDTDKVTTEEYKYLWEKGLISTKTFISAYKGIDIEHEQELIIDEIDTVFDDKRRIRNRTPKLIGKKEEQKKLTDKTGEEVPGSPTSEQIENIKPEEGQGEETPATPTAEETTPTAEPTAEQATPAETTPTTPTAEAPK
jgi:hypothetical protein